MSVVSAEGNLSTRQKGLTISPLRNELDIAPGTSLDSKLVVTNSTDKPMVVELNAEEFSVINQQYDYAFTVDSNVSKWVTFNLSEIRLLSGESREISFSVGAPLSAEPGGRYISIFASTNTGTSDVSVGSRQRVASLLYITVLGDVSRSGALISLSSPWIVSGDSTYNMSIQDSGTTHFRSRYNVKLQNLFGQDIASSSGDSLILPGTIRSISAILPLPKIPGIYKAIYNIGLGDTPAVNRTSYLLYVPPYIIAVLSAAIIILILALYRKRLRKS
jgi:hypothetical protein